MRHNHIHLLAILFMLCGMIQTSCSTDDDTTPSTGQHETPSPTPTREEEDPYDAVLLSTVRYDELKTTAYNFEYNSQDPYGQPARLSAAITIGDEVKKLERARGLALYSHYSRYLPQQTPSQGDVSDPMILHGSGLITISPDYYGFGSSGDHPQAYCMSIPNAQASVDALLAAKKLLPKLGYRWDDNVLFNIGYSQGGQTVMGIVKIITEQHPEVKITWSIAGGGLYDMALIYRQYIEMDMTTIPSAIVSTILSFREYCGIDIPYDQIFQGIVLENLDEWFLSRKYTLAEIDDDRMQHASATTYLTPAMQDLESPVAKQFLEAFATDNLCTGWTPLKDEHIIIIHHSQDETVPYENAVAMYKFLHDEQGLKNVELSSKNWNQIGSHTAHETGAIHFGMEVLSKVCSTLGILPWVNILDLNL
ncbi:MAG: hypothetical protein IJ700_00620 [Bacteroidaceae bacterium]|nr:hypothetical protein [Bacteroidaceae bacterium]MBR1755534.1 hypothetical protein [Bacteroidaceae bacterium]